MRRSETRDRLNAPPSWEILDMGGDMGTVSSSSPMRVVLSRPVPPRPTAILHP